MTAYAYRSFNLGSNWDMREIWSGIPSRALSIAMFPDVVDTFLVTSHAFVRTTNGENTWSEIRFPVAAILSDEADPGNVYALNAYELILYHSSNYGESWVEYRHDVGGISGGRHMTIAYLDTSTLRRGLFIGTHSHGVWMYELPQLTTTTELLVNKPFNFSISPNPARAEIQLLFDSPTERISVEVFDVLGRLIFSKALQRKRFMNIPIDRLNPGIYMCKASSARLQKLKSFVIVR